MLTYLAADIGKSMLNNVASSGNEQQDCRALGLLMVRLMEHGTSLQNPDLGELQHPELWNDNITSFLQKTTHCSAEILLKVYFLKIQVKLLINVGRLYGDSPASRILSQTVGAPNRPIHSKTLGVLHELGSALGDIRLMMLVNSMVAWINDSGVFFT